MFTGLLVLYWSPWYLWSTMYRLCWSAGDLLYLTVDTSDQLLIYICWSANDLSVFYIFILTIDNCWPIGYPMVSELFVSLFEILWCSYIKCTVGETFIVPLLSISLFYIFSSKVC
jgi:hypothetical protein